MSEAITNATRVSQHAQGAKVYGTYNPTHTVPVDILKCAAGHIGIHGSSVQLLKNKWDKMINTHDDDAKFLEICISGGADQVKNALATSKSSVQQRIIVLAIAPSVIIPNELCFDSYNYMSRRDFVTLTDIAGILKYGNELHLLEPHPDAPLWDHPFLSPTFEDTIKKHITNYIKDYGGER